MKNYEKPSELIDSEGQSLPDILLTYQQNLMSTTAVNQVVFCEKSRRIGITWAVAADAVMHAAANKQARGMSVYYMGYNLEMAREFINICSDWAKLFNQACEDIEDTVFEDVDAYGDTKEIKAFRIRFASGNEIIALPSSPRSLRGMQGYVIIDEAAFHDNLGEVLKAAYALLMWGGKVLAISTHDGADNEFNQNIQAIREKRKGFRKHKLVKITFRDAIKDGLYKRICLVRGEEYTPEGEEQFIESIYEFYGEGAAEELDVIPRKSGGVYFPALLVEPCMHDAPVIQFAQSDDFFNLSKFEKTQIIESFCKDQLQPQLDKLDKGLQHSFGFDFARSGDLSVLAPMAIEKTLRREVPFILELRNIPFTQQEQILFYIIDRLPRFHTGMADGTGNGAQIAEALEEKYGQNRIYNVKINVPWYEEVLPPYKAAFQDHMLRIPRHADILQDHRTAEVVNGVPQIPRTAGSDGKKRHGDSLIAIAGAYWASRQEGGAYEYQPVFPEKNANRTSAMRPDHSDDYGAVRSRNFGNNLGGF